MLTTTPSTTSTQGFSVSNVTEAYDAQVFAVATLLSSLLMYNSMHVLHANELEYLDLLVSMRKLTVHRRTTMR